MTECKYEEKIISQGEDIMEIKTDIKYIKKEQNEMRNDIKNFIESADKKYASKDLENKFYWLVGSVITFLLGIVTIIII